MKEITPDYKKWITDLKLKISSIQIKTSLVINSILIEFYWDLGKIISEKENIWGSKLIEQVARDLKDEFPEMKGFSVRNLKYCRQFYQFYNNVIGQQVVAQLENTGERDHLITQKLVSQIPWGHNILIFTKSKDAVEAVFYIKQTIENYWSRDTLAFQIKTDLYFRSGKVISNFKNTLPKPLSDLAQQTLKDPYIFDFINRI